MSDSRTLMSRIGRFDGTLLISCIVCGFFVGLRIAVWYNGYEGVLFLPFVAILFGLICAVIAHGHRNLVAFCSISALNMPWVILASHDSVLIGSSKLLELLLPVALTWLFPLALVLLILWATRD